MSDSTLHMSQPAPSTLVEILRRRALDQPGQLAYTFLLDGETDETRLTYGDLDRQARSIGAELQSLGAIGKCVLLLYPPGLDYVAAFFGCLYAGAIAVPAYPPDPVRMNRTLPRLQAIVADAQATVALTTSPILSMAEMLIDQAPDLKALRWLATNQIANDPEEWRDPAVGGGSLAFLQYTSGSTAAPRGVMLTHSNLVHNSALIHECFGHTPESRGVIWLPPYHDMGLIGGILQPLYGGFPVTLMSPIDFLRRPLRWLQAMSRHKATTSGGPNFAYDLCVRKITREECAGLDLSSWKVAFNGSESVRFETMEQFAETFACCGFRPEAFYPCYGLAEATLIVSGGLWTAPPVTLSVSAAALGQNRVELSPPGGPDTRTLVSCGSALADQRIIIVDPEALVPCPPGQVGEIWVSGPSVAEGYWNQPEKTAETFGAYLAASHEGPFLRTGDLGVLHGGELFVIARLKDLIIIRGHNHYPQDIELTVERSHSALRPGCCAAFSVPVAGEERLVVMQEIGRQMADTNQVVQAIRQAVAEEHELQVYAVVLLEAGSIPKTSSGKIQRHACQAGFMSNSIEAVATSILDVELPESSASPQPQASFIRKALAVVTGSSDRQALLSLYLQEQVAHVLGAAQPKVDIEQPLSALGLDSLMAVELQNQLQTNLGVSLPMADLLQTSGIAHLAARILALLAGPSSAPSAPLAPRHGAEAAPVLSRGQRALWFLHQLSPESAAYNISSAVRIRTELDVPTLRRAFQALVKRHSSLRTNFIASSEGPRSRIHDEAELAFQAVDASTWSEAALGEHLDQEAHRPFDLEQGPLMRVFLFSRSAQEHVLLLVVHHIVADFWSLAVLGRELETLYAAERKGGSASLAPLVLQYADYARWQADMLAGPEGERLWDYWQRQLSGELPALNLPSDHLRPPVQTFRGAAETFTLNTGLARQLESLSRAGKATLYMTLLAAFQTLLYRYSGQQDILIGSPTAGRSAAELAGLVGYFVNPVVLRSHLAGDLSFIELLDQVRQTVLAAFAHQEYPFDLLVERLRLLRDPSRSPVFQAMFTMQQSPLLDRQEWAALALGQAGARANLGELPLESVTIEQRAVQFDLLLMMAKTADGLGGSLRYNRDLFEPATIRRMLEHWRVLLGGIVARPERKLDDLPLLTPAEKQQLLVTWNDTWKEYPGDACIHELFEAQVERCPDATAVVFGDCHLTYQELNRRANQVAHYLRRLGIGPDWCVGICMERSLEMVVGLYAILKAGGAYVPLDPTYPSSRLGFMLQDSQVPILLTQKKLMPLLTSHQAQVICLDDDQEAITREISDNPCSGVMPDNLAYVIYTSGSTGQPKGAMNTHRGIRNRLLWMQDAFRLVEADRVMQKTPFSFDVSVWEFFWPLLTGASLVVARPEGHKDSAYLARLIMEHGITTLHFVPSMLQIFLQEPQLGQCHSLRRVICSGEALPYDLLPRFFARLGAELHNLYGPTEAAVDVTFWTCSRESDSQIVPIGRPIANTQIYLLDTHLQPVPIGVLGELYIGGVGLARGYHNQPGLTAEKFIPNPMSTEPGARLYRTGDLARYRTDGSIEFVGRIDYQVKVRGFRIELGEIEAVLSQHPAVREAVVLAHEPRSGKGRTPGVNQELIAYLVPVQGQAPSVTDLRSFLKERLPDYMAPAAFVTLQSMPLTPNGKVDRRALPAPEGLRPELETAYTAPRGDLERLIAQIWQEVLGVKQVGIYDNFFDLGGHSLAMARVHHELKEKLQRDFPIVKMLEHPTIAALAQHLNQGPAESASFRSSQDRAEKQKESRARQRTRPKLGARR